MKFYTWCNNKDTHLCLMPLKDSANMNGISVESIGDGKKYSRRWQPLC